MKYFKDQDGGVHAFTPEQYIGDDGGENMDLIAQYIDGLTAITAAEADELINPTPSIEQLRDNAIDEVTTSATNVRATLVAADQYKMANYGTKYQTAQAVIAGTATAEQMSRVLGEADERGLGETAEQLASLQICRGDQLAAKVGLIDGAESNARAAISALSTSADIDALLVEYQGRLNQILASE